MRRNTCTGGSRSWKIGEGYGDCKPIIGASGIAPLSRGRAFGHVGKAPLIPKLEWFWQSCRIAAKIFHIFECLSMFTCCIWFVTYMLEKECGHIGHCTWLVGISALPTPWMRRWYAHLTVLLYHTPTTLSTNIIWLLTSTIYKHSAHMKDEKIAQFWASAQA